MFFFILRCGVMWHGADSLCQPFLPPANHPAIHAPVIPAIHPSIHPVIEVSIYRSALLSLRLFHSLLSAPILSSDMVRSHPSLSKVASILSYINVAVLSEHYLTIFVPYLSYNLVYSFSPSIIFGYVISQTFWA